jgi:hypothetical protein
VVGTVGVSVDVVFDVLVVDELVFVEVVFDVLVVDELVFDVVVFVEAVFVVFAGKYRKYLREREEELDEPSKDC